MGIRVRGVRVGVIMPPKPLFPIELNIAAVIRRLLDTRVSRETFAYSHTNIWSVFPAGRDIFCNVIYFISSIEPGRFATMGEKRDRGGKDAT